MIENAKHTVDLVYDIFKRDQAGYAILGALCDAVERGVDLTQSKEWQENSGFV